MAVTFVGYAALILWVIGITGLLIDMVPPECRNSVKITVALYALVAVEALK